MSLAVRFPLSKDNDDGAYELLENYEELITQNVKNLILTNPGERIMDPEFGVGLRELLFEQNTSTIRSEFATRLTRQLNIYMPFLSLKTINFEQGRSGQFLQVNVIVEVEPLGSDLLVPVDLEGLV